MKSTPATRKKPAAPRKAAPRPRRGWMLVPGACLVLLLAAYLFHAPLLTGMARLLVVEDPLEQADLIYLFGGGVDTRPFLAADLYRRGLAPRVVLPREEDSPAVELGLLPNGTDVAVKILQMRGVPASKITVLRRPGGATSTSDDAEELARYLGEHPARRVLLVTSRYHTRRARWNVKRALGDSRVELRVAGAVNPGFDDTNWWRSEQGLIVYFEEYLKFAHNFLYR